MDASLDRGLKVENLGGETKETSRYIGCSPLLPPEYSQAIVELDIVGLFGYSLGHVVALENLRGHMKTNKRKIPAALPQELPILNDSVVCSTHEEAQSFEKTSDLKPTAFTRYWILDETSKTYRILVEGKIPPIEGT